MKKIKTLLCILVVSVLLLGCGTKITEGEIYEKEFVPAHITTTLIPMTRFIGKTVSITYIPQVNNHPDAWYIRIRSKEPNEKGKYEKAEYKVTEKVFNQYEVGDFYFHIEDKE